MLTVTIAHLPDQPFTVLGMVRGSTVQCKNFGRDFMSGLKNLVGGEMEGYTELMNEARDIATQRMEDQAVRLVPMPSSACATTLPRSHRALPRSWPTAPQSNSVKKDAHTSVFFLVLFYLVHCAFAAPSSNFSRKPLTLAAMSPPKTAEPATMTSAPASMHSTTLFCLTPPSISSSH